MTSLPYDPFAPVGSEQSLKRRSFYGSITTAGGQLVKIVLQLVSQVVLARLLFPADFGLLAMAYPVVSLVGLFNDIGVGETIIQRKTLDQQQISTLFWASIGLSIALALTVVVCAPVVAHVYGDRRITLLLIALAPTLPIGAIAGVPVSILSRQMRFGLLARIDVGAATANLLITLILAAAGASYWSLIAGQYAFTLTSAVGGWVACRWRPMRWGSWRVIADDLRFGGNITGANLASFISTSADNIIIGLFNGPIPLGLYDRSYRLIVQPIGQLLAPVGRVALPLLSRHVDQPAEYRLIYLDMLRLLNLATIPLMIVCMVDADLVAGVILGPRWVATEEIFPWIAIGGLAAATNASATWLFVSRGRTASFRRYSIFAATVHLLSFTAGASLGLTYVAAFGAVGFTFFTTPTTLFGATKGSAIPFADVLKACLLLVVPGVVAAVILSTLRQTTMPDLSKLLVSTVAAYGVFLSFCLCVPSYRKLLVNIQREIVTIRGRRAG